MYRLSQSVYEEVFRVAVLGLQEKASVSTMRLKRRDTEMPLYVRIGLVILALVLARNMLFPPQSDVSSIPPNEAAELAALPLEEKMRRADVHLEETRKKLNDFIVVFEGSKHSLGEAQKELKKYDEIIKQEMDYFNALELMCPQTVNAAANPQDARYIAWSSDFQARSQTMLNAGLERLNRAVAHATP